MIETGKDLIYHDKVWGKTAEIMHNKEISLHHLHFMAGGRCSIHYHKHRRNEFYVTKGKVLIETWCKNGGSHTVVSPGERFSVDIGFKHRFSALSDGEMYEIYYPVYGMECLRDDIVRLKEGYMTSPEELEELIALHTISPYFTD